MRRFLLKLTLFLVPLALLLSPGFIVLLAAGEFVSIRNVGRLSRDHRPMLAGNAYTNYVRELKMFEAKARHPKVLALGTSRVGQFRSRFFRDPGVFYNASMGGTPFVSYRYFLDELGSPLPAVVIVDMLQPYFGPADPRFPVFAPNPFKGDGHRVGITEGNELDILGTMYQDYADWFDSIMGTFFRDGAWWKVYADYAAGKFTLRQVFDGRDPRIVVVGLRALTTDEGTTNDGSDRYGRIVASAREQERVKNDIAAMVTEVANEARGYGYGAEISAEAVDVLKEFLQSCKDRNIFVIGFLPPMPHAVYKAMRARPDAAYAEAFRTLSGKLRGIYAEYGFDFYDFQDPAAFGGSDKEMVNSTHGSEKMYLRLFIRMAENSRPLSSLVDLPSLKATLEGTEGDYQVFPLSPG